MNKESFFIKQFGNALIGDDGAVVGETVYSMDAFFENVHFKRSWMTLRQIARKAMLVNISDAIAMNAVPKQALLSVAMPKDISPAEMEELAAGFQETAEEYGIDIIGGDTIANVKLDISVTIISTSTRPLRRDRIRPGMLLAYTGDLGRSLRDLKKLLAGGRVPSTSRFISPTLRYGFIKQAGDVLAGGMDISDGLGTELSRIARSNRLGFRFFHSLSKTTLCSGEEYEMLVAFHPKHLARIRNIAKKTKTPLTIFAETVRGNYRSNCKANHF